MNIINLTSVASYGAIRDDDRRVGFGNIDTCIRRIENRN